MSIPPAYRDFPGGPLELDRPFYEHLSSGAVREKVDEFVIAPRSGRAWTVPAGHVTRISVIDGPQVGDLNVWNLHNPRERFWAARTRQLQRANVQRFDRLWSTLPYLRPMLTMITDTLGGYEDADGTNMHDLLGTRCDPYVNRMFTGDDFDLHCHSNLTRAVRDHGLTEWDVHDVLNVFQASGLNDRKQYATKPCPAEDGDHVEFFAEIDVLCALSTCPGGDQALAMWGPDASTMDEQLEHCHPLQVEVFSVDDASLAGWTPPTSPSYRAEGGRHGLQLDPDVVGAARA